MNRARRCLLGLLLAAALVCSPLAAQPREATGSLRGIVMLAGTQEPAPFLNVVLVGTPYGATTDASGHFAVNGLPAGKYEVVVSGIGYARLVKRGIIVSRGLATELMIEVVQESVQFAEVQVSASISRVDPERPVSTQRLTNLDLKNSVSGWDDVFRSISGLPGIAPANIERNDLIVRGGAPSENLYVVDNIELPTISHFATQGAGGGSSTIVPLDCVDRVTFSSGGFGVQYGDKLSSAMSIALREGDRERTIMTGTLSATQFGASLEGPLSSKTTFLVLARKSYLDLVFKAYDMSFAPDFVDVLGKVSARLGAADRIDVLAVAKSDKMRLFDDTEAHRSDNADIVFGNQTAIVSGITWKHFSESAYTLLTFANSYGRYQYFQTLADQSSGFNDNSRESETLISFDAVMSVVSSTDLSLGVRGKFISFNDQLDLQNVPWFLRMRSDVTRIQRSIDTNAVKLAAYGQLSHVFGSVLLNAGVRMDYFDLIRNGFALAPRLSAILHLSPMSDISASVGRYFQSPAYKWMANSYNRALRYAGADQAVLGVSCVVTDQWRVKLEGYLKKYFDYPSSIECPVLTMSNSGSGAYDYKDFGLDSLASSGSGTAKGIELFVQKSALDSTLSGVVSITYSKVEFTPVDGTTRPADHDMRWIVNVAFDYLFATNWEFGSRFRFYTGHPYLPPDVAANGTMEEYYKEYNRSRVGINHNLDIRLTRRWRLGRVSVESFLDIQNAYNRKPLDTPHFDYNLGQYTDAKVIGIIPSIGLTVKF